jgi:uncharacterized membrane protein
MRQILTSALLWFSAIGCGLLAGVYFAFSAFVMTSLGRIGPPSGIAAMNAINADIVKSLFMPLFLGTSLSALLLAISGAFAWKEPGAIAMCAGGILYVIGMTIVTMAFNVPLNDALAAVAPASEASLWSRYLTEWTWWNHVRTVACAVSFVLFIVAIARR